MYPEIMRKFRKENRLKKRTHVQARKMEKQLTTTVVSGEQFRGQYVQEIPSKAKLPELNEDTHSKNRKEYITLPCDPVVNCGLFRNKTRNVCCLDACHTASIKSHATRSHFTTLER